MLKICTKTLFLDTYILTGFKKYIFNKNNIKIRNKSIMNSIKI